MSWLSRLLGEMPEETKYKSTSSFKVKDSGDGVLVTSQPIKNYQSENVAKNFINKYREKPDDADELTTTAESPAATKGGVHKSTGEEKPASPLEVLFSSPHSENSLEDLMKTLNNAEKEIRPMETLPMTSENLSGMLSKLAIGAVIFFILILGSIFFFTGQDFSSIFSILFWIFIVIIFSAGKKKTLKNLTDSRK
ncbi:MAG: hypothetical protein ABIH20_01580 [Candidatus Diapherotrites archaeon]